jgi:hypothetical protein
MIVGAMPVTVLRGTGMLAVLISVIVHQGSPIGARRPTIQVPKFRTTEFTAGKM